MRSNKLIYVVEDSKASGTLYCAQLSNAGYETRHFLDGHSALVAIKNEMPDIIVQDVQLPDISGLDVLKFVNRQEHPARVVMITANSSIEIAVEAMRLGGFDFIEKPFTNERLLSSVASVIKQIELDQQVETLEVNSAEDSQQSFVGESLPMQTVFRLLESAARCKASVFITGESGTGKEVCALSLHNSGARRDGPFVAINCAAIPGDLFESEFFGHVKGAFSGAVSDRKGAAELAHNGTLFLDEICEMDLGLQAKLLRFLQTGRFTRVGSGEVQLSDVRIVCATNRNPAAEVGEGRFREDLFYRLNVIPVHVPPLRERDSDVLLLARHILLDKATANQKPFLRFSEEVESLLQNYDWPGNIRELQNVIENTVIFHTGEVVDASMLPPTFGKGRVTIETRERASASKVAVQTQTKRDAGPESDHGIEPLWLVEQRAIKSAIESCDGNIPLAAAHLRVSASTIYRKIKSWESDS